MPDKAIQSIQNSQIAITGVASFLSWLLAYVRIDVDIMIIFTIFMAIDTVTGVIRVELHDMETGERTFSGAILIKKIIIKIMFVILVLMVGAVGAAAHKDTSLLVDSVLWLMILKELYSVTSTINYLVTGNALPEWNILGKIGRMIRMSGEKNAG